MSYEYFEFIFRSYELNKDEFIGVDNQI